MKIQQLFLIVCATCCSEVVIAQGQIGIGTTTPEKQLHITGALKLPETRHADTGIIYLGSDRFIHNYHPFGSVLLNTFVGRNAGNLAISDLIGIDGKNTGIGAEALSNIRQSTYNTAIGAGAMKNDTAGFANTAIGAQTMLDRIDGNYNTCSGFRSIQKNKHGNSNSAFGSYALYANETGSFNTAIGAYANGNTFSGDSNTCLGYAAGYGWNFSLFSNSVMLGAMTGYNLYDGTDNIVIGYKAGYAMEDCDNNVLIGARAVENYFQGNNNIFIGHKTGESLNTGNNIILIGHNIDYPGNDSSLSIGNLIFGNKIDGTGSSVSTGNIGIGTSNPGLFKLQVDGHVGPDDNVTYDLGSSTTKWRSIYGSALYGTIHPTGLTANSVLYGGITGNLAFESEFNYDPTVNRLSSNEINVPNKILMASTTSSSTGIILKNNDRFIHDYKASGVYGNNIFIGTNAGNFTMSGATSDDASNNTSLGYKTLNALTSGQNNTAVGANTLEANSAGDYNTALGASALAANSTGNYNVAIGYKASYNSQAVMRNTAIGMLSNPNNAEGSDNVTVGANILANTNSGAENTIVGSEAAYGGSAGYTPTGNTIMGYRAGYSITGAIENILLGYKTGDNISTGDYNILIGNDIDAQSGSGNQQLSIGNLIFGTNLNGIGTTTSNGNIGIGVSTPDYKLQVDGTLAPEIDQQDLGTPGLRWDGNFYNATVDGALDFSEAPALPKIYNQSTEPDIPENTFAFWFKTSSEVYVILDIAGTQKKALMND